jgi:hypothetical protein
VAAQQSEPVGVIPAHNVPRCGSQTYNPCLMHTISIWFGSAITRLSALIGGFRHNVPRWHSSVGSTIWPFSH